jgi:mono/diheme cytochrome c family protein
MKKNKYLLLFSSLGVLLLLLIAAASENFLKEWHFIQGSARTQDGPIEVRLRQVVNTDLARADRCVTCHVGMAPGEQIISDLKVAQPHKPVVHDTATMGCTVCHGGQGQATEKDDAHGTVEFWMEPMLPAKYAYASCGTCHTPLNVPNIETLSAARRTFERLDCYSCHRLDGRGGTLRPGGDVTGMEGPDLSHIGLKGYDTDWYTRHSRQSLDAEDGLWRNAFREISEADRAALKIFLDTQMGAPKLIEARAQFNSVGCTGCHVVGNFGGDIGPDLSRFGERDPNQLRFNNVPGDHTLSNWVVQHFRSPASTVPGSLMPAQHLSEQQADLLTMYVLSLRRRSLPDMYLPKDRVLAMRFGGHEFASNPETVYSTVCASCHGATGRGMRFPGLVPNPSITNPDFLELASDDFILATIQKGRPGRPMLPWGDRENGLTADEMRALVAYIRQLGGNVLHAPDKMPPRWVSGDPALGERLFSANCAGCHGLKGVGNEGPALGNQVFLSAATDTYLVETISRGRRGTIMQGFSTPSVIRPTLTRAEIEAIAAYIRTLETR